MTRGAGRRSEFHRAGGMKIPAPRRATSPAPVAGAGPLFPGGSPVKH